MISKLKYNLFSIFFIICFCFSIQNGECASEYSLIIEVDGLGSVSPLSGAYKEGTNLEVTASSEFGSVFYHWELDEFDIGNENPLNLTMDDNHTLRAVFTSYGVIMNQTRFESITSDINGGYVISSRLVGGGGNKLSKMNLAGEIEWEIEWDTDCIAHYDRLAQTRVIQTSDDGFALICSTLQDIGEDSDIRLIKYDQYGNELYNELFGGYDHDYSSSIKETQDGGLILVGSTLSFSGNVVDIYLMKTDSVGNELWTQILGEWAGYSGYEIIQTSQGEFIIVGYYNTGSSQAEDILVIKTDKFGNEIWKKTYGSDYQDGGYDIIESSDGNFVFTGSDGFSDSTKLIITKIDPMGNIIWEKQIGQAPEIGYNLGYCIKESNNGDLIVVGESSSSNSLSNDLLLVKLTQEGEILQSKIVAIDGGQVGYSFIELENGDLIVASSRGLIKIIGETYELFFSKEGLGSSNLEVGINEYSEGENVSVEANPDNGWLFDHWILNGNTNLTNNPLSFQIYDDTSLTAVFIPGWDLPITVSLNEYSDTTEIGLRASATEGFDILYDELDAPPPLMGVTSYTYYPENQQTPIDFRKLSVSKIPSEMRNIWMLKLKTENIAGNTTIIWDQNMTDQIPLNYQLLLLDSQNTSLLDMRDHFSYSFESENNTEYSFFIQASYYAIFSLNLDAGWNMVSLPVIPDDLAVTAVLDGVEFYQLVTWSGSGYVSASSFEAGRGYWLLVLEEVNVTIFGDSIDQATFNLSPGWSMVGGPNSVVQASEVFPGFYQLVTWTGSGYISATVFEPGKGYWALVLAETSIQLPPT